MASATDRSTSAWIQSPLWDAWWIFSGLWAPALVGLGYLAVTGLTDLEMPLDRAPHQELLGLFVVFGILHRLSPIYTALFTPILRDSIRADPMRFVYVPAAILLGCVLVGQAVVFHGAFAFLGSERAQLWAFFLLAAVFVAWDRWHFCMQEFGVLSIYRIRAGQQAPADRSFDRRYTILLMLFVNTVLFMVPGSDQREVLFRGTSLAELDSDLLELVLGCAFAVGAAATAVAVLREWRHPRRSFPKLAFYLLIGSHSLLLYAVPNALGLAFLGYIFHHWMVAVGLFNRVVTASYGTDRARATIARYLARVGPVLALCVAFYAYFAVLDMPSHLQPVPDLRSFTAMPAVIKLSAGVAIGLFFAFNYLHYWYDRQVYSFSNPHIRASVGPLLFGRPRASAV